MGVVCPDFKNGECLKGLNCEYAHGVFEFWLHPSKFRTRPCESGLQCTRRIWKSQGGSYTVAAAKAEPLAVATPLASSTGGGSSSTSGGRAKGSIVNSVDAKYTDYPHLNWDDCGLGELVGKSD